jgi:hypothetical protein
MAGGVLIAHYPTGMQYTNTDVCEFYSSGYALTSAEQQVNRIDVTDTGTLVTWFVISAWSEPKKFCGVEFGIGNYDEAGFAMMLSACGPCGTGFDPLEIPTGAWPGPGTGIALATPAGPWRGNYVPVYFFSGYAYAPGTKIELTINPTEPPPPPFAGWANCDTPPVPASAGCLGAMGILQDGTFCEPNSNPDGACCFGGGVCQILSMDECDAAGGTWDGSPVCADPNPCPVIWACCTHNETTGAETCQMLTTGDCSIQDGIWHSGQTCGLGGFTCPLIRACCIDQFCTLTTQDECTNTYQGTWLSGAFSCLTPANPCLYSRACCFGPDCQLLTEPDCVAQGGVWMQNEEACGPLGNCPDPIETTTWGAIKAIYR